MILSLTEAAEDHLACLSVAHLDELARLEPALKRILTRLSHEQMSPAHKRRL
jgi:hypothetical protein